MARTPPYANMASTPPGIFEEDHRVSNHQLLDVNIITTAVIDIFKKVWPTPQVKLVAEEEVI